MNAIALQLRALSQQVLQNIQRQHQARVKALESERRRIQEQLANRQEELRRLEEEQCRQRQTHEAAIADLRKTHSEDTQRLEDKRRREEEKSLQTMRQLNAAVEHKEALIKKLQKDLQGRSLDVER